MISITKQIEAMTANWPNDFELIEQTDRPARWIGYLKPNKTKYKVRISYRAPFVIEAPDVYRFQPRVQVLDPVLKKHLKTNAAVPHVYRNDDDADTPYLCLFDPKAEEWSPNDLIALTTVPWTSLHLYYYEGWQLTGKWLGPERHPTKNDAGSSDKRTTPVTRNTAGFSTANILARLETLSNS
jgi:hypothetical protein